MAQRKTRRNAHEELRRRLRTALAWYGMTLEDFAVKSEVTVYHLSEVLKGRRASAPLIAKVVTFVTDFEREFCEQVPGAAPEPKLSALVA